MKSERPKSKRGAARNAPKRRDSVISDKPSFKKNSTNSSDKGEGKEFGNKKFTYKKKPKKLAEKSVDDKIRLNRFLANAGICSRREADKLIETGVVSINNKVITVLGTKVTPDDVVHYGGMLLQSQKKQYVLLNKPKNYITTMDDPEERQTVMELISKACKERIYPVGRLDRATSGLLLFTNDGEMTKRLTHPSGKVKKTYHVTVDKNITQKDLIALVEGVQLEDGPAGADKAFYLADTSKSTVSIELHSGRNRIIRRMMEHLGYKVTKLDRVQFAGLTKKDIPRGRFRHLSEKEVGLMHRVCGLIPQDKE
ncbi:rRNA pseudouridine synthase [Vicingaceae bacterium]|nr:rRNA pseudouridine synthase [Vicingaceae bacterium]MDB4061410.1 rRNA pseudouridine synthase [Vicingaceae bacterium]MDC1451451.1 rRNA pseudouridine synthase [Vicingaceae bacterium]